jgi:hypothetical protein
MKLPRRRFLHKGIIAWPGGILSLCETSNTGYSPKALWSCNLTCTEFETVAPSSTPSTLNNELIVGASIPFVELTAVHVPNGAVFSVDIT